MTVKSFIFYKLLTTILTLITAIKKKTILFQMLAQFLEKIQMVEDILFISLQGYITFNSKDVATELT